jgi:spore coat protein A
MLTRRQFLKGGTAAVAGLAVDWHVAQTGALRRVFADRAAAGLSDPALQPKFVEYAPNALDPGFIYQPSAGGRFYRVGVTKNPNHETGLLSGSSRLKTPVWGYGQNGNATWPGMTFEVEKNRYTLVRWENNLFGEPHLLPVDTSLHWCYSLPGYDQYTIDANGVPIVTHLHGGHTFFRYDGNPEQFFSPGYRIRGPHWGGRTYAYQNNQPAGTLWYHDHALGITRLNVYAGLAGFYIIRDQFDTGKPDNPLNLPAWPYELAYAIQDRMFRDTGALFYPAFPGDPAYADFIDGEGAVLPENLFPGGGPTALAEFFGDHMVVNGKIWPKEDVEPRRYRMRLLNGTDSRFMVLRFRVAASPTATDLVGAGDPLPFDVIGSDQGLASAPTTVDTLVFEPGSRYDIIFDFSQVGVPAGSRVIIENIGGDAPFGGAFGDALGDDDFFEFRQTDRIMAFDVVLDLDTSVGNVDPTGIAFGATVPAPKRVRKVALFEGRDEFGRLQPLLGTAEPATDLRGRPINWPNTQPYIDAGLTGQMEGAIAWHSPTTENPAYGRTEEWEIWNTTVDAHPVHLHLVHFEVLGREEIVWDSATNEDDRVLDPDGITAPAPNWDGTYLVAQPVVQHNGALGSGFRLVDLTYGAAVPQPPEYVENARKDMVTALPGQITRIRAKFDRLGRYVWHCHILSHEDHEMMRVLHVGPGA